MAGLVFDRRQRLAVFLGFGICAATACVWTASLLCVPERMAVNS